MSTSSGREGFCERCGHSKNEHALKADSKCKKCKRNFEICQQTHSGVRGRRLCYIPCSCGEKYYPDKAKAAVPLEPHEYLPSHPGYWPLEEDSILDTSLHSSPQAAVPRSQSVSTHNRNDSQESEDPLQWSDTKYEQNAALSGLAKAFAKTSIGSVASVEASAEARAPVRPAPATKTSAKSSKPESSKSSQPSKSSKSSKPSKSTKATDWNEWEWREEYKCEYRSRKNEDGEWEYEYRQRE